jgi:hypothetical protein
MNIVVKASFILVTKFRWVDISLRRIIIERMHITEDGLLLIIQAQNVLVFTCAMIIDS